MKKKETVGRGSLPIDRVRELTGRGFSEVDVIDILRKDGYSPEEIDKALTQVTKSEVGAQQMSQKLPTLEDINAGYSGTPEVPETSLQTYYQTQQQYPAEEYIDYVVQMRLQELNQKFVEFSTKTQELEKRTQYIYEKIDSLIQMRSGEQNQLITKIDLFKDSISEIESRLSGLEKAFKETLPALIESVRALSDLVQRFKREA